MKKIVISLLLASGAGMALAAGNQCDKPRNDFDDLYCLNKVYIEADKELNRIYGSLSKRLNAQERASLKKGQLQWMRTRNNTCSRNEGDRFFVDLACATNNTITRAQFLQDRERECVSSGCRSSLLGGQSGLEQAL